MAVGATCMRVAMRPLLTQAEGKCNGVRQLQEDVQYEGATHLCSSRPSLLGGALAASDGVASMALLAALCTLAQLGLLGGDGLGVGLHLVAEEVTDFLVEINLLGQAEVLGGLLPVAQHAGSAPPQCQC